MGAFFSTVWALIKNAPTYFSIYMKLRKAWLDYWLKQNQKKQDEMIDDLKKKNAEAIENKDQRPIEEALSGEPGGQPAEIREGVEERPSNERLERQARERKNV